MPSWCTLYKGLFTLVVFLIIIEYFFGTIEYKNWESVFTFSNFNTTRADLEVQHFHSPLLAGVKNHDDIMQSHRSNNTTTYTPQQQFNNLNSSTINPNATNTTDVLLSSSNTSSLKSNTITVNATDIPLCPDTPPTIGTRVKVLQVPVPTIAELEHRFGAWLKPGGHGVPDNCRQLKKVAIIIPYRCRAEHLLLFMQHMHPFLHKQQIDYTLYVIEQSGAPNTPFNRASLMNVGFKESLKFDQYDCFIFHDIDLLPEDERNLYSCPTYPRHMSVAIDLFSYRLPYSSIFGGVSAITREHFELLNGFSNSFWGWGGEDDDMSNRITYHNLQISRYPESIARYTMLTHKKEKGNPDRWEMLKAGKRKFNRDGLSNLQYTIKEIKRNLLYTWMLVELGPRR